MLLAVVVAAAAAVAARAEQANEAVLRPELQQDGRRQTTPQPLPGTPVAAGEYVSSMDIPLGPGSGAPATHTATLYWTLYDLPLPGRLDAALELPNATGWLAWGLGTSMAGSDVLQGWVDSSTGMASIRDCRNGIVGDVPVADASQDVLALGGAEVDGTTTLRWSRLLDTGDVAGDEVIAGQRIVDQATTYPTLIAAHLTSDDRTVRHDVYSVVAPVPYFENPMAAPSSPPPPPAPPSGAEVSAGTSALSLKLMTTTTALAAAALLLLSL